MTATVRVALIQQAGLTEDRAGNVRRLLGAIDAAAPHADAVMPTELCHAPYFGVLRDTTLLGWAERLDGELVEAIAKRAAAHAVTILLPLYLACGASRYNAVLVIGPDGRRIDGRSADGSVHRYFAKVHLPSSWRDGRGLDEPFYFAPGDHFPVFETPVGKVGVLVCYDRRFPEAWRALALAGAEIVFVPACVPVWSPGDGASTADLFLAELRTRACENGVFVAACGRAGTQQLRHVESRFVGRSCIVGPAGEVLAHGPADEAATVTASIDPATVARVRRRLTLWRDRRPEVYPHDGGRRVSGPSGR